MQDEKIIRDPVTRTNSWSNMDALKDPLKPELTNSKPENNKPIPTIESTNMTSEGDDE
jgi:hypothetical protein